MHASIQVIQARHEYEMVKRVNNGDIFESHRTTANVQFSTRYSDEIS